MQSNRVTRHQNTSHEHSMTVSRPQQDRRQMIIPDGTVTELGVPSFSLPFRYLRTWIFSLLALIALPLGAMLFFIGAEMEQAAPQWTETQATVISADEDGIRYEIETLGDKDRGFLSFVLDDFVDVPMGGIELQLTACDLASRFIVPQETDAQFTVWVNPDDNSQHSCVPISSNIAELYTWAGIILLLFSAWRLVRTIHAAGLQPKKA